MTNFENITSSEFELACFIARVVEHCTDSGCSCTSCPNDYCDVFALLEWLGKEVE